MCRKHTACENAIPGGTGGRDSIYYCAKRRLPDRGHRSVTSQLIVRCVIASPSLPHAFPKSTPKAVLGTVEAESRFKYKEASSLRTKSRDTKIGGLAQPSSIRIRKSPWWARPKRSCRRPGTRIARAVFHSAPTGGQ